MDEGAGKGDDPRPVDPEKWDKNQERIFGTEKERAKRRRAYIEQKKRENGFIKTIS